MHDLNLLYTLLTCVAVLGVVLTSCALLIYVERKVAAYVQDRIGPNRVGPYGLLQSLADGLKFLFKEDIIPGHVDKPLYLLAPALAVTTGLYAFTIVPFGDTDPPPQAPPPLSANATAEQKKEHEQKLVRFREEITKYRDSFQFAIAPGLDIGILFVFAIASLNVYGIILGGWSGNNKYSLLGALRSSAQIVSYEIPMALSATSIFLLTGSLNLERIIAAQSGQNPNGIGLWLVLLQPLAFVLFLVSAFAETNRLPFDLPEAEQELIGGFHTEYSALKFGLFFIGEYAHLITTSFLTVILFWGGWQFPWLSDLPPHWLWRLVIFGIKVSIVILFFMLIRWTIPRFRFDQLMSLAWKVMIPLAFVNLLCVMVVREFNLPYVLLPVASVVLFVAMGALTVLGPSRPPGNRRMEFPRKEPAEAVVS
jgi:NADH-quinone oxidoreductase subunit H